MRIIASSACLEPRFAPSDCGGMELFLHFGHTTDDILKAAEGRIPDAVVSDFVSLWADPEYPRVFEDLGGSLVIRPL